MDKYLMLATVALALILPYVAGTMLHHFLTRNWEKAIGWLLLFWFCLTEGLGLLVMAAVELWESPLNIPFLNIAPWVMHAQAVLWGLFWFMYKRRREPGGWRTVAVSACLLSLAVGLLIPVTYNTVREQRIAKDQELLNEVGYKQYPGADYLDGKYKYHGWRGGECLSIHFLTDDDPDSVFGFYEQCAENAGLQVSRGTSKILQISQGNSDIPVTNVLWAVGDNPVTVEIEQGRSPDEWTFSVYWSTNPSFVEDHVKYDYDLAP